MGTRPVPIGYRSKPSPLAPVRSRCCAFVEKAAFIFLPPAENYFRSTGYYPLSN